MSKADKLLVVLLFLLGTTAGVCVGTLLTGTPNKSQQVCPTCGQTVRTVYVR